MRTNREFVLGLGLLLAFATLAQGCGDSHRPKNDLAADASADARATGGGQGSGGASGNGGTGDTGGTDGSGGATHTGGVKGTGGSSGSGGASGAGGVFSTGGESRTDGGTWPDTGLDGPEAKPDVAIDQQGADAADTATTLDLVVDQALDLGNTGPTCGGTGQACCKELSRAMAPGEQRGMCISNHDVCGNDGLCGACGREGQACCANSRCDNNGCCSGGLCVMEGSRCGDGNGVCTNGACADCGREGQSCCSGSCGPNLACNTAGTCACGGRGEPCCGSNCDDPGLGCFGYTCQPGTSDCPATAPRQGAPCNYLGTAVCRYPSSPPWVYDCLCPPYGWSCVQ